MLSKKDFAGTSKQDRFKISVGYATLIQGLNPFKGSTHSRAQPIQGLNPFKGSTHMILLVRISILQFLCGDFFDSIGHAQRAGRLVNESISDGSQAVAGAITVLALDMYEHAYHLDFGANSRLCGAFMRNIDWSAVQGRYEDAVGVKRPRPLEQKQFADLPSVMVDEVQAMLEAGAPVQIIDTRPRRRSPPFSVRTPLRACREGVAPARRHAMIASGAGAAQNEQPNAWSEVLIASMVCLQVVSMVDFVAGFLDRSSHILRVWSSCDLYIARCASGSLEATQLSYFARKSSQAAMPVLCACAAAVMLTSKAAPMTRASANGHPTFRLEPATAFDVA